MRALPLVLALLVVAGCEKVRINTAVDAGPVCEGTDRLVNGACRFVCTRDGDCATGQRCDLLTGECEPRPAPIDAGDLRIPCTEGAVRCSVDNSAVQTCGTDGVFTTSEQCVQPEGYCQNEHCLRCRPGATRCPAGGATVEICLDDGSGYRSVTCAAGASCVSGQCVECTVGQRRCSPDNHSLQECQRLPREDLSAGYVNAGDNFDGTCVTQVCEQGPQGPQCHAPACLPGAVRCANPTTQQVCSPVGGWTDSLCSAQPNMGPTAECLNGACIDECGEAIRARSYFGCEYWSAVLDNSMDTLFKGGTASGQGNTDSDFVFVVTNQSAIPATVEVWRYVGSAPVRIKSVTVPGRTDPATKGLMKIPVPWQSISPATATTGNGYTGRARYAYRLTSTRPVTVYQFNPIDAVKVTNKTCTATAGTTDCACNEYSFFDSLTCLINGGTSGVCTQTATGKRCGYGTFSNDASLLLPAHILGQSYVAVTPGHSHIVSPPDQLPRSSQMTIVATATVGADGGTSTVVTVRSSGVTQASTSGTAIAAMAAGETRVFTLQSYEVLQLSSATSGADLTPDCSTFSGGASWCRKANDLTGSIITSDKPVALFGSNPCLNVPWSRSYCDHVEEQVFPFNTWGQNFVAVPSNPLRLNNNNFSSNPPPDQFKIVAGAPTTLTLTPPPAATDVVIPTNCLSGSLATNNCALAGGSFVEFKSVRPFTVHATAPIAVAQFFPGQGTVTGLATDPQQGDPSMVLLPPIEQWRSRYTVLASTGLKDNYLGLSIDGAKVMNVKVDGVIVTGFNAISGTTFQSKNYPVTTGTHTIEVTPLGGQQVLPGAGVTVYGYDAQVSYGYTGGLDLTTIVTGINPGG